MTTRAVRWLCTAAMLAALACNVVGAQGLQWATPLPGVGATSNDGTPFIASKIIKVAADGSSYVLTGSGSGSESGTDYEVLLVKFSPSGTRLWTRVVGGALGEWGELPQDLAVDTAGNATVTVIGWPFASALTARFAPDGTLVWKYLHWSPTGQVLAAHAIDPAGGGAVAITSSGELSVSRLTPAGTLAWRWTAAGGTVGASEPVRVAFDSQGNVLVVSVGSDVYAPIRIHKLSPTGALLWNHDISAPNAYLRPAAIAVDTLDNLIVAGVRDGDALLVKLTPTGALLWQRTYNGTSNQLDGAAGVAVDAAGNIVAAGRANDSMGLVLRYAPDGTLLWSRTVSGANFAGGVSIVGTDAIVAGQIAAGGKQNAIVQRYDVSGDVDWTRIHDAAQPGDYAVVASHRGGAGQVGIVGWHLVDGALTFFVGSIDGASGAATWIDDNPMLGADRGSYVPMASRGLIGTDAAGNVFVAVNGYDGVRTRGTVAKVTPSGVLAWRAVHAGGYASYANSIAVHHATGAVVLAGTRSVPINQGELFVDAYDANGALQWTRAHPGAYGGFVAADSSGNTYVAGTTSVGMVANILLLKYDVGGTLLWSRTYRSPTEHAQFAGLVLDGSGRPILAEATLGRVRLVRYSTTGAIDWEYERVNPSGGGSQLDLGVDAAGNVYYVANVEAVKVDSAGIFQWAVFTAYEAKIVVAPDGTSVVLDNTFNGFSSMRALRPDGTDKWFQSNVGQGLFVGRALALDASGNVIVTGASGNFEEADATTVKLAAVNGAVLWRHDYAGSEGVRDHARAVTTFGGAIHVAAVARESGRSETAVLLKLGNASESVPPDTMITSMPPDPVATNDVAFRFTANEPVIRFECSLDGQPFFLCPFPARYTDLALGQHTFAVRAQDMAGNVDPSPATYSFTVNKRLPSVGVEAQPGITFVSTNVNLVAWLYDTQPLTGTVGFSIGGQALPGCSAVPVQFNGFARYAQCPYMTPTVPVIQVIRAEYSGDATHASAFGEGRLDVRPTLGPPCGGFADVPSDSPFCGNVEWIANRNVTLGCATNVYCAEQSTVRVSMAAFMNRLGKAMSPSSLFREQTLGASDLDSAPQVCATEDLEADDGDRQVFVDAVVAARSSGNAIVDIEILFSFDAGTTWVPSGGARWFNLSPQRWQNHRIRDHVGIGAAKSVRAAIRVKRSIFDVGNANLDALTCVLRGRATNAPPNYF